MEQATPCWLQKECVMVFQSEGYNVNLKRIENSRQMNQAATTAEYVRRSVHLKT